MDFSCMWESEQDFQWLTGSWMTKKNAERIEGAGKLETEELIYLDKSGKINVEILAKRGTQR